MLLCDVRHPVHSSSNRCCCLPLCFSCLVPLLSLKRIFILAERRRSRRRRRRGTIRRWRRCVSRHAATHANLFMEFTGVVVRARRTIKPTDVSIPPRLRKSRELAPRTSSLCGISACGRHQDRHQSASTVNSRFRPRRTSIVESWLVWLSSAAYSLLAVHMHGLRCRSSCSPLHLVRAQRLRVHLYTLRRLSGQGKRTTRMWRRPA